LVGDKSNLIIPLVEDSKEFYRILIRELGKNSISNMPFNYARHFQVMKNNYSVSPRMWGNIDFVYETQHVIDMPGSKLKKKRYYTNKYRRDENFKVINLEDNPALKQMFIDCINGWAEDKKKKTDQIGRLGDPVFIIENFEEIKEMFPLKIIGVFDLEKDCIAGVSFGVKYSNDYWCNAFGFTRHAYNSMSDYLFNSMARLFDEPFEIDGDGNGKDSDLFKTKSRYISPDVEKKQISAWQVSMKKRKR